MTSIRPAASPTASASPSSLHPEELGQRAARRRRSRPCRAACSGSCRCRMSTRSTPSAARLSSSDRRACAGVEAAGLRVAVELGREDPPLRPAAELAHHLADPLLAPPQPVEPRAVEEPVRHRQHRAHRCQRPLLVDVVAVGVGHAADARGPEPDRRHPHPGPADLTLLRHAPPPCRPFFSPSVQIDRLEQRQRIARRRRAAPASARRCASSRSRPAPRPAAAPSRRAAGGRP